MNIKQAEAQSSVTRQNIRFYEKQGLLSPARNPENDYREYTDEDVHTLKCIRALRMLDMPLEDVRLVLNGQLSLADAATEQKKRLEEESQKLSEAIRFCGILSETRCMDDLDVDACLTQMEKEPAKGFFQQWKEDYKAFAKVEQRRFFTFISKYDVTTPRKFTDALFAYAEENNLDLVITKESMEPEFTIDGVEYTACRDYSDAVLGGFTSSICCKMLHPDEQLPDINPKRLKKMRIVKLVLSELLFTAIFLFAIFPVPSFSKEDAWQILFLILALHLLCTHIVLACWRYSTSTTKKKNPR